MMGTSDSGDECARAQHRAVAAEADGHVEALGQRALGHPELGPAEAGGVLLGHLHPVARTEQPVG